MGKPDIIVKYTQLFINNQFVDAASDKKFATVNPSDETIIAHVAEGEKVDIDKAVTAAKNAFSRGSTWRKINADSRGILLNKLADLLERDIEYIASLESIDNGKPYLCAVTDVEFGVKVLRYYGGWADKIQGSTLPSDGDSLLLTRMEPVGVVGHIIPWNYPFFMAVMKLAQALAAGCTVVMKPAEQTPLTALYLAALTKEVGFPPGVINIVTGYGPTAGAAITEHPDIRKIGFTGSTEVGHQILSVAGKTSLKHVTLELGGKSPLVIFDDVNLKEALNIAHNAIFFNSGQICFAASRVFVQSKIYDEFVKGAKELALKVKIGDPFDASTKQGPQIDDRMFKKVLGYIESGKKDGAVIETGGERAGTVGYFIKPTIFTNVKDDMKIAREEIFGPVQLIFKFDTLDEVIERANDTSYGLAAGVLTKDLNKAIQFAENVNAGTVWINRYGSVLPQQPFGGYKDSGIGRELGYEGLLNYLETKTISIEVPSLI